MAIVLILCTQGEKRCRLTLVKSHALETRKSLAELPRWPFTAMLAFFPVWWVLGIGTIAWIPIAACMVLLMVRRGRIEVPRGAGIWLLFLVLMAISVIQIDTAGRLLGFVLRAFDYFTVTVVFVYIYNARERLTTQYVLGVVTLFWLYAVVGGFAGVFFPTFSFRTPFAYVLPGSLQSNELVGEMVVRRLTQYKPDGWFDLEPRPSAPFLYTNQWGNVYSLVMPMVFAYLIELKRGVKFWLVALLIPLSLIPAILTLNRGMFIGLGVAAAYLLVRFVLMGRIVWVLMICGVGAVAAGVGALLNVGSRVTDRVETSSSTEDRANLYEETFHRTLESPIFGYGAPRPSTIAGAPSAGTQGHLWTVMFSYGFPALICFLLALILLFAASWRATTMTQLLLNAVQLVILVELLYYGVLPVGLILSFTAAALALRDSPRVREQVHLKIRERH